MSAAIPAPKYFTFHSSRYTPAHAAVTVTLFTELNNFVNETAIHWPRWGTGRE